MEDISLIRQYMHSYDFERYIIIPIPKPYSPYCTWYFWHSSFFDSVSLSSKNILSLNLVSIALSCVFPCGAYLVVCKSTWLVARIPAQLNDNPTFNPKSWSWILDHHFPLYFPLSFLSFLCILSPLSMRDIPEWPHQCHHSLTSILIFLLISVPGSASWAHMGVQIPLRPPQRRGETRGWRRQLPDVRQMASSTDCATTLKQKTSKNTENFILSISTSTSLALTTMLLLYITVSACTTSSSPPGRRRPSLTEKITSSLQTRWWSTSILMEVAFESLNVEVEFKISLWGKCENYPVAWWKSPRVGMK